MALKKLFTDYQAKVNEIIKERQIQIEKMKLLDGSYRSGELDWLKSFLLYQLPQSQIEPVYITYQGHSWYMNVFERDLTFRAERELLEGKPFVVPYHSNSLLYPESFEDVWLYQDAIYGYNGRFKQQYSLDEQKLLILESVDKERKKFEKLKQKFLNKETEEIKYERTRIPEEVRIAVWRRDQGKCAQCGSREKLEYDHIVPVSMGGGNTARNIELLCQDCNRSKGNRIK